VREHTALLERRDDLLCLVLLHGRSMT